MSYFTRVLVRKALLTGVAAAFTYKMLSDEEFRTKVKEKGKDAYETIKDKAKETIAKIKEEADENTEVEDAEIETKEEESSEE